jgi:hypothetical protein
MFPFISRAHTLVSESQQECSVIEAYLADVKSRLSFHYILHLAISFNDVQVQCVDKNIVLNLKPTPVYIYTFSYLTLLN